MKSNRCSVPAVCLIVSLVVLGVMPLAAQYTTASLGGTVVDPTGAVVPEANVTVRNTETGLTVTTASQANGAYLFSRLPVGTYELTVEKPGFRTYVQAGITLTVNQVATQNVTMAVGEVTERVTVEAEAPLITTRTATAGQLIDQRRIVDLPLNGRSAQTLLYLSAGTLNLTDRYCNVNCHGGVYPTEAEASVGGSGPAQVNYQLDATSNNDTYININLPFPNPDSIQEFNLQSSNFTAEYGNAAGGIVNIVTRSGTNEIHGSAFEFLRNGNLNARNFFAPEHDGLKRNQFGASFGGPIVKDKLFYFGTYQGTRVRNVQQGRVSFVPTQAQRSGDFSSVSTQLVDPVTGEMFPNNQIPVSRFSPVSQYFLERIPLPNGPNGQLTFPGPGIVETENQFMPKVDYQAGSHQISGRYYFTDFDAPPKIVEDNVLAASSSGNAVRVQSLSANHTYTASPTLLINSTFGWNRQRGGSLSGAPFSLADAGAAVIGPESVSELNSPPELVVTVTGGFRVRTNHLGAFDRGDFTVREVVTKIKGAHELHFGGEAVRVWNNIVNTFQMAGQITFNGQLSGNGLADFMLGRASDFRQGGGEFKNLKGTRWGFFTQDNWRVNQRLSLNLGVRWDPYIPYYDRKGRVVCFQQNPTQPSQRFPNAPLGFLYGGDDHDPGCPVAGSESNWGNVAPRFGFAYRLTSSGNTVLRGGSGFYYTPIPTSNTNPFSNVAPFGGTFTLNDVAFEDPFGSKGLENPFPANFGNTLAGPDFVFAPINDIRAYFTPDYRIPLLTTWTLRLEHQLGANLMLSTAYLGNKGTFLQLSIDENPAIYIPGVDAGGNPLSTVGNTQERRIFPQHGRIRRTDAAANSQYHSLQFNVEKRFSQGFSVLANYTWSKATNDLSSANPFNRRFEHALSNDDVKHNFKFSNVFQVPTIGVSGVASRILNGWSVNSVVTWQSGFPLTISSGRDNAFAAVGSNRADFLGGDASFSGRSHAEQIQEWFDTSKFTVNAIGTFGNSGRNILRGPRLFNSDISVLKDNMLAERVNLQFRAEFFNIFNNVNFYGPSTNASSGQFGRITSARDPRILQFGLKILF